MSVLVSRGGEAAAALSKKLEEIWAGGRRERKREEADGHSCPVSCTPWCGGAVLVQAVHSAPIWWVGLGFQPKRNSLRRIGGPKSGE